MPRPRLGFACGGQARGVPAPRTAGEGHEEDACDPGRGAHRAGWRICCVFAVEAISRGVEVGVATSQPAKGTAGPPSRGTGAGHSPPIAVVTDVAKSEDVPITLRYVGWVQPIASVAILTQVNGVIRDQAVVKGQTVKAGDVLFHLDDAALQAVIAKDQASLDQLNADLARLQTLAKGKDPATTEQQVQQQQALVNEGAATVADDKAQLQADQVQLDYATITAPISGRIGVINDTVGARVQTSDQTPLLTIT